jgi:hypothetical protein
MNQSFRRSRAKEWRTVNREGDSSRSALVPEIMNKGALKREFIQKDIII